MYKKKLSPVVEGKLRVRIGQSIRCKDCGAHLPWSQTHKHLCSLSSSKSPLPSSYFHEGLDSRKRRPSMKTPTWQNSKSAADKADLIVDLLDGDQNDEVSKKISWDDSLHTDFFAAIPTNEDLQNDSLQPSWSWAERERDLGRKHSMPVKKASLDEDIIAALNNRSKSVPEMTAAAKMAQLRRKKSTDCNMQKQLFENMLTDLDGLMRDCQTRDEPSTDGFKGRTGGIPQFQRPKRRPTIAAGAVNDNDAKQQQQPVSQSDSHHQIDTPERRFRSKSVFQRCNGCKKPISVGLDQHIEAAGSYYHVHCFKCEVCGKSLKVEEPFWQDVGHEGKELTRGGLIMCQGDYEWIAKTRVKNI